MYLGKILKTIYLKGHIGFNIFCDGNLMKKANAHFFYEIWIGVEYSRFLTMTGQWVLKVS